MKKVDHNVVFNVFMKIESHLRDIEILVSVAKTQRSLIFLECNLSSIPKKIYNKNEIKYFLKNENA
jgi:hypothetical protein